MASDNRTHEKSQPALGFLTVLEHETDGLFGGYLILNLAGRPLEFHCTAPIRANRAQEILYGPTLEPYLYGEQIGQNAVGKGHGAAAGRLHRSRRRVGGPPVGGRAGRPGGPPEEHGRAAPERPRRRFRPTSTGGSTRPIRRGRLCAISRSGANRLAVAGRSAADRDVIADRLRDVADSFDLAEPFCRIREAIEEARGGGPRP